MVIVNPEILLEQKLFEFFMKLWLQN